MVSTRNPSSSPALVWSSDFSPSTMQSTNQQALIMTRGFANRHVVVWLPECNVIHTSDSDVLGGRGKHLDHHPGNVRLTELADKFKTAYHHGTPSTKREIVDQILNTMMNAENRRFLKLVPYKIDANIWCWVPDSKCYAKVSQKLRDAYKTWARKHVGTRAKWPSASGNHGIAHPPMPSLSNRFEPIFHQEPHFQAYANLSVQELHVDAQSASRLGSSRQRMAASAAAPVRPLLAVTNAVNPSEKQQRIDGQDTFRLFESIEFPQTYKVSTGRHHYGAEAPNSRKSNPSCNNVTAPPPELHNNALSRDSRGLDTKMRGSCRSDLSRATTFKGTDNYSHDFFGLPQEQGNNGGPSHVASQISHLHRPSDLRSQVSAPKNTDDRDETVAIATFLDGAACYIPMHNHHHSMSHTTSASMCLNTINPTGSWTLFD